MRQLGEREAEINDRLWTRVYTPNRTRRQYTASLMHEALGRDPDPAGTLVSFLEEMTPDETQALRSALRRANRRSEA
ncbi:hypothetical protein [Streptomyces sp. NPDC005799]|uniref:hypothetical protein n=1 Tax=Streptomyces sp. NPDC005799 TaxID=3154678 RepID=UPI0033EAAC14